MKTEPAVLERQRCGTEIDLTRRYCEEPNAQKDLARTHMWTRA